jgi:acyl dehydratase
MTGEEAAPTLPYVADGIEGLRAMVGLDLGPSAPIAIDQDRIDRFAEVTEDRQWIHVDPVRAAAGPFGATIAHGYLTLSLLAPLLEQLLEVREISMSVNYGLERVRFPSPVVVGSTVRARAHVVSVEDVPGGVQMLLRVTVEVPGAAKPACVAESLARFYA